MSKSRKKRISRVVRPILLPMTRAMEECKCVLTFLPVLFAFPPADVLSPSPTGLVLDLLGTTFNHLTPNSPGFLSCFLHAGKYCSNPRCKPTRDELIPPQGGHFIPPGSYNAVSSVLWRHKVCAPRYDGLSSAVKDIFRFRLRQHAPVRDCGCDRSTSCCQTCRLHLR